MNKSNHKFQNKRRVSKRVKPTPPIYLSPPPYKAQQVRSWVVRFDVSANGSSQTLTATQLAAMLGIIATSATTSVFLTDSFRLKRATMWSWTGTPGTTVDIMLKYSDAGNSAGQGGPPCVAMDSSASQDRPAFVTLAPPKNSSMNLWQDTPATTVMLSYYSPQASILDLEFQFIIDDIGVAVAGPAIAGATLGNIYHKNAATCLVVQPLNRI